MAPAPGHFYESALSLSDGIPFTVSQTLELNTVCLQDTKFFFREDFSGAFDLKCIFYFFGPRVESPLFQYIEHNEKGEILLRLGIVILFVLIRFYRLIFQIPSMGSNHTSLTEPPDIFSIDKIKHILYIAYIEYYEYIDEVAMPRLISAPFFSEHPVFRRAEYAAAVGRQPGDKVVTAMLAQHLKAGNIQRIAREVFASVPQFAKGKGWVADRFLAASRLRPDGVIAYHSALELHGYAYTVWHEVQVIADGEPGMVKTDWLACRFVRPPRGFAKWADTPVDGVTTVDRLGLEVKVTTVERTISDLFDRHDLAGGAEELFNSLDLVARVDADALIRHTRARGNAAAAGALGFWLEREREQLAVPERALEELRTLAPTGLRYALGAKPGFGKTAKGWNVILPAEITERRFEGL